MSAIIIEFDENTREQVTFLMNGAKAIREEITINEYVEDELRQYDYYYTFAVVRLLIARISATKKALRTFYA